MEYHNLFLCAYNVAGLRVFEHCLGRGDIRRLAVFTHPAAAGAPDIVKKCNESGIWCTTENVNAIERWPFSPTIIASVYYRYIIKSHVLDELKGGIFNLHPSLLPKYRGCSSIPWAIINAESMTGISYHYIDEAIDAGRILLQATLSIEANETQATLYARAMELGVQFWPAAFELVKLGFEGVAQEGIGSMYPRGVPYDGVISESWDEVQVERFIRAMTYPPYPHARFRGQIVKSIEDFRALRSSVQFDAK